MATKELSRLELVQQAFECCQQCVRAYGPSTVPEKDRLNIINHMEHFKMLAERDINKE